jgi:hypothetical protein
MDYLLMISYVINMKNFNDDAYWKVLVDEVKHENLTPTPQPWEDGIRTDPMIGTYEWWYYQLQATDGTSAQFIFYTKPWFEVPLPFDPLVSVVITSPNSRWYKLS